MTDATPRLSRQQALRLVEGAYLAAATGLIWLALYYLPVGGALFRLALPLPLILLQLRRGNRSGAEGLLLSVLLLTALMGPLRGPLLLFPYGLLSLWLGWSWCRGISWWLSWSGGVVLGTAGFLVRVLVLSLLVGENLWVLITRARVIRTQRFSPTSNESTRTRTKNPAVPRTTPPDQLSHQLIPRHQLQPSQSDKRP